MSEENVEVVRLAVAAFAKEGVEGLIPFNADAIVIYSIPEWPDDPEYHGHAGVRTLSGVWEEAFDDFRFDLVELQDAGDLVVGLFELSGRFMGSTTAARQPIGAVFSEIRDGKIGQIRYFSGWETALSEAGVAGS
ncbi:MAG: nuclear transport factor 2 family protein [Solirubrobacterales bacterium]